MNPHRTDAETPAHRPPAYLGEVEGLRGVAALIVVVYHCFTTAGMPDWRPVHGINVLRVFHDGWCGVNLFLVLSGFCLFWPFARNGGRVLNFPDFMQKRARRIVPAYYASLILTPIAGWLLWKADLRHGPIDFMPGGTANTVLHLLLLHSFSSVAFRAWNGVTWSLGLEWTWYLFFPVAVWMFRRLGPTRTALISFVITVGYCCGVRYVMGPTEHLSEDLAFTVRTFLPGRLFEFVLGMLVAWQLADRPITKRLSNIAVIGILPLLLAAHLATPVDVVYPVRNILYGTAFSLLLLAAISANPNPVSWFCRLSWVQLAGTWSYSLYLFHLPIALLVSALLAKAGVNGPARFFLSLLGIPIMVLMAKWEYALFERPFLAVKQVHAPAGSPQPSLVSQS